MLYAFRVAAKLRYCWSIDNLKWQWTIFTEKPHLYITDWIFESNYHYIFYLLEAYSSFDFFFSFLSPAARKRSVIWCGSNNLSGCAFLRSHNYYLGLVSAKSFVYATQLCLKKCVWMNNNFFCKINGINLPQHKTATYWLYQASIGDYCFI